MSEWRPLEATLRDVVAWLHERGLVSARQTGAAAGVDWRGSLSLPAVRSAAAQRVQPLLAGLS